MPHRKTGADATGPVAFVLGGGGIRGAVEVGQVQAILEAGVTPDLVVGTSIGAINGALIAQTPSIEVMRPLQDAWSSDLAKQVYGQGFLKQVTTLAKNRNHTLSAEPLRRLLEYGLGKDATFESLAIPFFTVAARHPAAASATRRSPHSRVHSSGCSRPTSVLSISFAPRPLARQASTPRVICRSNLATA